MTAIKALLKFFRPCGQNKNIGRRGGELRFRLGESNQDFGKKLAAVAGSKEEQSPYSLAMAVRWGVEKLHRFGEEKRGEGNIRGETARGRGYQRAFF